MTKMNEDSTKQIALGTISGHSCLSHSRTTSKARKPSQSADMRFGKLRWCREYELHAMPVAQSLPSITLQLPNQSLLQCPLLFSCCHTEIAAA